jgi:hypothetical protein
MALSAQLLQMMTEGEERIDTHLQAVARRASGTVSPV